MVDSSEWIETLFCPDCAIIIANDDDSGVFEPEQHRRAMSRESGAYDRIVGDAADLGFRLDTCGGCGQETFQDDWFAGWLIPRNV